ncbi:MAG: hypothetical protein GTN73_03600 [Candidatus Aminicenantes bacterium]|nr:hypothetical protein [Candidatus Aminicenantes bacterium]
MRNKILVRTLLLSLLVLVVCFAGFSKEETIASMWRGSPLSIDGADDDWASDTLSFEKKYEVDYAFKNDAENLYVLFVFKDPLFLSTVKDTGMTFWINTEGKKKKKYGITYKMINISADDLISLFEEQRGPLPEDEKNRIMSKPNYTFYQGDVRDKKGNILTPTALGGELPMPVYKSQPKQKMMVYEFVMPLRILEKLSAKHKMEPGKTVKVGFEWGGLTERMKAQRMARLRKAAERGSGSEAGTTSSKEREMERRSDGELDLSLKKGPKKYSFWVDVKLAQKD